MKITLDKEEKLELIHTLMCTNHDYFEENSLLLSWNDKDYKNSCVDTSECYEDVILNMLKKGHDIILKEFVEEGEIVARFNLQELFKNLDNPIIDEHSYYSSIDNYTNEVLAVMLDLNWDAVTMTRISSVLFYHNEKTRK